MRGGAASLGARMAHGVAERAHGRPARGARRTGPGDAGAAPPRLIALNSRYTGGTIIVVAATATAAQPIDSLRFVKVKS